MNATAIDSVAESDAEVDVVCLVVDAPQPFGSGDEWVAGHLDMPHAIVVVNKIDRVKPDQLLAQLAAIGGLGADGVLPGVGPHRRRPPRPDRASRRPRPKGRRCSRPTRCATSPRSSGSPSSCASSCSRSPVTSCRTRSPPACTEWEGNRITVEIVVERDSQKGMVIGKGGSVLKQVGQRARAQLPEGTFLELRVKVDKDWQRRPDRVERLGYYADVERFGGRSGVRIASRPGGQRVTLNVWRMSDSVASSNTGIVMISVTVVDCDGGLATMITFMSPVPLHCVNVCIWPTNTLSS